MEKRYTSAASDGRVTPIGFRNRTIGKITRTNSLSGSSAFLKSFILTLAMLVVGIGGLWGQNATNYTFSTNATGSLTSATWSTLIAAGQDEAQSGIISMGFPFFFNGSWYNNFSVSSNGLLRLGNTTVTTALYSSTYFPAASAPLIAPYYTDLQVNSTGLVRAVIAGSAPSRVLVVQWFNMEMNYNSTTADATFECRLYESNGQIEFVYGGMTVGSTSTNLSTNNVVIGFCNSNTSNNVFSINQTSYSINNTSATAIVNTNSATGAISTLSSSADGSRRVFTFTPNYTFDILTSGNSTWTAPCGITSINADAWGAGGGGGNSSNTATNGGTGGGGGAYARGAHTVNPSSLYYYQVGSGGAGGPASSTTTPGAGTSTWLAATAATNTAPTSNVLGTLAAGGGAGVNNSTAAPTNGATTAASFGNLLTFKGGNGGAGSAAGGGGGGASGGSAAGNNGATGTGTTAGGGLSSGGGNGGAGSGTANGTVGSNPGAGGGGGNDVATAVGGAGAAGRMCIWYPKYVSSAAPTNASASAIVGCSPYSTTLTQAGGTIGTGGTWKWYSDSCGGTLVGTSTAANASLTISVSANTTYYVRSEGACLGGTTACAEVSVTVTPIPACVSAPTPTGSGQSASGVTLSWGAVSGATSYDIYFGTNGSGTSTPTNIVNGTNQAATTYVTGALTGSTTYYFQIVPKNTCGSASSCTIYSFTTSAACTAPTFSATPTSPLCVGQSNGSISVSASGGSSPYEYSKDNGLTWQAGSSFTGLAAGIYVIVVKGNDGCTAAGSSTTISNPIALTASVSSATLSGCSGNTVSLGGSASGGTGALTYSWSPTTGLSSSSVASPTLTISGTQAYTLTVTDANNCTSNQPTVTVSIGGITKYWAGAGSGMSGATTGTDFNAVANWSSTTGTKTAVSAAPQSCDDVVIAMTSTASVIMSSSATINSLIVKSNVASITTGLNVGTNKLTVIGDLTELTATGITAFAFIQVGNSPGEVEVSGTATFGDYVNANSSVYMENSTITTGSWRFKGNVNFGLAYDWHAGVGGFGSFIMDGTGTQTINTNSTYSTANILGSIKIGDVNTPTVIVSNTYTAKVFILNAGDNLTVKSGATLDLTQNQMSKLNAGGTFTLNTGSTLKLSGPSHFTPTSTTTIGSNFPINYTTYSFNPTSTVEYYGGTQLVNATPTYGNLTISTSGNKTAGAGFIVSGNLTVNPNATLGLSTFTHSVSGNLILDGTLTMGASTGILNLTGNCSINSTGTLTCGTTSQVNIGGGWTKSGVFNPSTSTVNFVAGSTPRSISGTSTFNNLTLSAASTDYDFGNSTNTINGNFTVSNGTMLTNSSTFIFTGSAGQIAGNNSKRFHNLQVNSGAVISGSAANIAITGNYTNNGSLTVASTLNTTFNGGTTQSLSGNGTSTLGNVIINAGSILNAGSHNFSVSGSRFNVSSNSTFNGGTSVVSFTSSASDSIHGNGVISFAALRLNKTNGTVSLRSNISVSGALNFEALNAGTINLNGKTLTYSGTSIQSNGGGILGSSSASKLNITKSNQITSALFPQSEIYDLEISGVNTNVTSDAEFTITNDLIVGSQSTLTLSDGFAVTMKGNVTNNGTINGLGTSSELIFDKDGDQSVTGAALSVGSIKIDKLSGNLTLNAPLQVKGTLTMTKGDIITTTSNILEIGSSETSVGSVSWATGTVRGPMKRWFAGTAAGTIESGIFPVGVQSGGKAGTNRYAQVNFASNPGTGGYIVAEYKTGSPGNNYSGLPLNYSSGSYPQAIQNAEEEGYWDITPYSAGNVAYAALNSTPYTLKVRLQNPSTLTNGWTPSNDGNDLYNASTVRLIRSKGSTGHASWELAGTHVSATETGNGDYFITSSGITEFSWFNGGGNDQNPLPVELLNFNGTCEEGMVNLVWQTASEFNSSHFDVEKSTDGETWRVLATIPSAGTSNELLTYKTVDNNGTNGSNYYRLRQVDVDGKEKLYDPINVSCAETTVGYFTSYPNPSGSEFQVIVNNKEILGACTLNIVDAQGKVIDQRSIEVKDGINMFVISETLNPGIYFLNITNGTKTTQVIKHAVK